MNQCPNCGWKPEDVFEPTTADTFNKGINFTTFMDKKIKQVAERMEKELGYGRPDRKEKLF